MSDISSNKRIAKNTMMLYFRMAIGLVVGLYTSRIVLEALGESDYGLYSVVGGIVVILSFLNSSLSGATQRFMNFELGKQSIEQVRDVFKTSIQLHIFVSLIILIFAETLGLWFLNTKMNIAPERMFAANWVYQFSIVSCLIGILMVPFCALIIANERMSAFAYLSLFELVFKLLIVFLLLHVSCDRLILYAALMPLIGLINLCLYIFYCRRQFEESHIQKFTLNTALMKAMMSFSGWSVVGSLGYMSHTQGIAIVINIFFGTLVNAAQGIANQINGVVTGFVSNFLTALNPQIVKLYAADRLDEMHLLVIRGCKFSFYLVAIFAIPLMFCTHTILHWWLTVVPNYTTVFVKLILLISLFNSFTPLLASAQGATGKVKYYQITLTTIGLLHVPIAWLFFYWGYEPYSAMVIYLVIIIILQICRTSFVCASTKLSGRSFVKRVVTPCLLCVFCAYCFAWTFGNYLSQGELQTAIVSEIVLMIMVWSVGFTGSEREMVMSFFKRRFHKSLC